MRAFFSKNIFHQFLYIFKYKSFVIFAKKTSQLRWKRHLQEMISFDTHSTAILSPFTDFEKKSLKKPNFSEKPSFVRI